VLAHVRATQKRFPLTLVEGAGGLLSPLGDHFNSRDLIVALRARPFIVAPNKLGVVNHVLLTLEALPKNLRSRAGIILMSPAMPDTATSTNAGLLARLLSREKIFTLPWLGDEFNAVAALKKARVRKVLAALARL
jgi:dethiobiotin synthetase